MQGKDAQTNNTELNIKQTEITEYLMTSKRQAVKKHKVASSLETSPKSGKSNSNINNKNRNTVTIQYCFNLLSEEPVDYLATRYQKSM